MSESDKQQEKKANAMDDSKTLRYHHVKVEKHNKMLFNRAVIALSMAIIVVAATPCLASFNDTERNASPLPSSHNCIRAKIISVSTRLVSVNPKTGKETIMPGSGFAAEYSGHLPDPYVGKITPNVVFYQNDPANEIVAMEKAGDLVQACVISFPNAAITPTHTLGQCDPVADRRGRILRIYDYKLHYAYIGQNSEHGCGGA